MSNTQKIAVVTGGASGIGEAVSVFLARDGVEVAIWDMNLSAAQEVADGMNADEAEASLVKSLQELGVTMMAQWVQNTQKAALEQALQHDPSLNKHSKKNSNGIPPSAP